MRWKARMDVELSMGPIKLMIDQVTLEGPGCLICRPLLNHSPVIGGFQIFYCETPKLELRLNGLGGITKWSTVDAGLRKAAEKAFQDMMVLPNRTVVRFANTLIRDLPDYHCPPPIGVLRVRVLSASRVHAADRNLLP